MGGHESSGTFPRSGDPGPTWPVSDTYTVLHDSHDLLDAELPLDRASYEALVTAVLAWQDPSLTPRDYE